MEISTTDEEEDEMTNEKEAVEHFLWGGCLSTNLRKDCSNTLKWK